MNRSLEMVDESLRRALTPQPRRWAVAVSGGRDSMMLLHGALRWMKAAPSPQDTLRVLHLDHALHPDSESMADFVKSQAERAARAQNQSIVVHSERLVGSRALIPGGASLEAQARRARYDFFRRMAAQDDLNLILLGQHRDDQAETIAHDLLRGSAVFDALGMPKQRALQGAVKVGISRPFLELPGHILGEALNRIDDSAFREDPTNTDRVHRRNRIRHDLMKTRGGHEDLFLFAERSRLVARRADALFENNEGSFAVDYLMDSSGQKHEAQLNFTAYARLTSPLADRWLRTVARTLKMEFPPAPARRALGKLEAEKAIDLSPKWRARRRGNALVIEIKNRAAKSRSMS